MKGIFKSPDKKILLIKKIFDQNNTILQALSFFAFGLLIYDLGFRDEVQTGFLGNLFYVTLLFLSIGFCIRLFSKTESYSIARYVVEVFIILFLLIVSLANFDWIHFDDSINIGNLPIKAFFVNLLILILFLIELSKMTLAVNQLKIHPALVFILSFIVVILIGTGMLLLPNATTDGISLVDALFTSTSAVCVTGLIVLDTSSDFTFLGQFIILILFQIGGLGMMTFTSFFGFFFKGSYSL